MNFNEIRDQISAFREELLKYVESLPMHAEGVTPLDKKGKYGTVNFSTLAKNNGIMCADYYLNHTAKKELLAIIKRTRLESLDKVVEKIIKTACIPNKSIKMNPQFISRLRDMWEKEMNVTIFLEHDVVVTTCLIDRKEFLIPKGIEGTIIHRHTKPEEAFVIEFSEERIVTVYPKEIDHAPKND